MTGGRIERIAKNASSKKIYPCELLAVADSLKMTASVLFTDGSLPPDVTYVRIYISVMYDILH